MFRARKTPVLILIALLLAGGIYVLRSDRTLLGLPLPPAPAPSFVLEAPYRGGVSPADFRGRAVLLTFGRPSCGAACSPQLETLRAAMDRLGDRRSDVRVLFVTLEPDSMNLQELLAFVQDHDLGFTGLRGDQEAVQRTAEAYRAVAAAVPDSIRAAAAHTAGARSGAEGGSGAIDPRVYGIDRNGILRVAWEGLDPAIIARDTRTLLRF